MDVVPYLGLALFVIVTWWTTLEKVRIGMYISFFRMTYSEAREYVMRPGYRAGLWATRVLLIVLAAGLLPLFYFHLWGQSIFAFLTAMAVGVASWCLFYWRLSKAG
jgi:hypothetical protein